MNKIILILSLTILVFAMYDPYSNQSGANYYNKYGGSTKNNRSKSRMNDLRLSKMNARNKILKFKKVHQNKANINNYKTKQQSISKKMNNQNSSGNEKDNLDSTKNKLQFGNQNSNDKTNFFTKNFKRDLSNINNFQKATVNNKKISKKNSNMDQGNSFANHAGNSDKMYTGVMGGRNNQVGTHQMGNNHLITSQNSFNLNEGNQNAKSKSSANTDNIKDNETNAGNQKNSASTNFLKDNQKIKQRKDKQFNLSSQKGSLNEMLNNEAKNTGGMSNFDSIDFSGINQNSNSLDKSKNNQASNSDFFINTNGLNNIGNSFN